MVCGKAIVAMHAIKRFLQTCSIKSIKSMSLSSISFIGVPCTADLDWAKILSDNEYERYKKVQVGKDQEKAQSEKDSHSKNRGGKKPI